MIISHKHKFIFIKPQKTAGTSIELLLSRICGDEDIITPLGNDPDPNVREKHQAKNPQNFKRPKPFKLWEVREFYWLLTKGIVPNLNYKEHLTPDIIKSYVGEEIWNSYKKISIVRNPWDHAVSWFKWQAKYGYEKTNPNDFEGYIRKNYRTIWPFFTTHGVYDIDFMIRFEEMETDIKKLAEILPEIGGFNIPQTKNKIRNDNKTYHGYFNETTKSIVEEKSCNILKKFNYSF